MKHIKILVDYELKKIFQKKILWIVMVIFLGCQLFLTCGGYALGKRYADGKFLETNMEWYKIDRENGEKLSGREIDDNLLSEVQGSYKYKPTSEEELKSYEYLSSSDYQDRVRPYENIDSLIRSMLGRKTYSIDYHNLTSNQLYKARRESVESEWEQYKLTDEEKEYWQEKEDKLPQTFTYQYAETYASLVDMSGCYYICMLVTFFIAICMVSIFSEEHARKTDQLVLCTKYGRRAEYIAKVISGVIATFCYTALLWGFTLICFIVMNGTDGFSAMVQVSFKPGYSGSLTIGQTALIMTGLLFLLNIVICMITMTLSEVLNSTVGTMALVLAVCFFLARLIYIPADFKLLGKIWNLLPLNLLKADQGFFDVRLFSVFGIKLTIWQFAPVVYILLGAAAFFIGRRVYCRYQVSGR